MALLLDAQVKLGYSDADIATLCGVTKDSVLRWRTGEHLPATRRVQGEIDEIIRAANTTPAAEYRLVAQRLVALHQGKRAESSPSTQEQKLALIERHLVVKKLPRLGVRGVVAIAALASALAFGLGVWL